MLPRFREFNKLEKEYSDRGVKVVGLAVQSGWASDIQKFVKQYNMRYTVLVGNDDTVADFGVISFPNTYVIAPGWKPYKKYSGVSENKASKPARSRTNAHADGSTCVSRKATVG